MAKANKVSYRGTCAWCFREFQSSGAKITQRHGWQEVSTSSWALGGRTAGSYGNVSHNGNCSGMNYQPYELSPLGTEARQKQSQGLADNCAKRLVELAARPDLLSAGKADLGYNSRTYKHEYAEYGVRLAPGEVIEVEAGTEKWHSPDVHNYEEILKVRIAETEAAKARYEDDVVFCKKMIAAWTLKEMKEFAPRKATVHYKNEGKRVTYCGSKGFVDSTADEDMVTCSRCIKVIEKYAEAKAEKQAAKDNGLRIHAWLTDNGTAPAKAIKKTFDLDQKQFNKAVEALDKFSVRKGRNNTGGLYVGKNWDAKPATYYAGKVEAS